MPRNTENALQEGPCRVPATSRHLMTHELSGLSAKEPIGRPLPVEPALGPEQTPAMAFHSTPARGHRSVRTPAEGAT
jgi:hypothetical protein